MQWLHSNLLQIGVNWFKYCVRKLSIIYLSNLPTTSKIFMPAALNVMKIPLISASFVLIHYQSTVQVISRFYYFSPGLLYAYLLIYCEGKEQRSNNTYLVLFVTEYWCVQTLETKNSQSYFISQIIMMQCY